MTLSNLSSSSLYRVGTGLIGVGNWAQVTATTGSPTTGTYTDANGVEWKYYRWSSSGSVTTTAGLVDALLVGGGSYTFTSYDGQGGRVLTGIQSLATGSNTVTIGAGGTSGSVWGGTTSIGSVTVGPQGPMGSGASGAGAGGVIGTNVRLGIASSITGSSVTYAEVVAGTPAVNTGQASYSDTGLNGGSGIAIIRVPSTFALV